MAIHSEVNMLAPKTLVLAQDGNSPLTMSWIGCGFVPMTFPSLPAVLPAIANRFRVSVSTGTYKCYKLLLTVSLHELK